MLKKLVHLYSPDKLKSKDPTATIKEGIIKGIMMAFSICKKSEPMNLTYITSLCDQSSSLVRRLTPKMIPIKTPANVAMVKALDFKVFKTTWPCFEGILNYKNETKSRQTAMSFKMFGEV